MRQSLLRAFVSLGLFLTVAAPAAYADDALKAAVADAKRAPDNSTRDGARHPYETLSFWGLKPHQTVIELEPGGGYWTEIIAPYLKATGGTYVLTMPDTSDPKVPEGARRYRKAFENRFADEARFGKIHYVGFSGKGDELGKPGSADLVITARNLHNFMWEQGGLDRLLKEFYTVLKPGGLLGVEDHRADPRKQVTDAHDGYVNTDFIVAAAEKAGFKLDASSEINANPKDTKDYPFGVWTLPPTNTKKLPSDVETWQGRPADSSLRDAAFYKAIGESDRMTLRFRKPS